MIKGFYTGALGVYASRDAIDIHANNIANSNTAGFKASSASFSDTLYTQTEENFAIGGGVRLSQASASFAQGFIEHTGQRFDYAIKGGGFFAVMNNDGQVYFTRNGKFNAIEQDDKTYLTLDGLMVLDDQMKPLTINNEETLIKPGVFSFSNPYALQPLGGCLYAETVSTGQRVVFENANIKNGFLEASSADLITEMTSLMEAQRAFSLNAKIVQTADDLEHTANNLRG